MKSSLILLSIILITFFGSCKKRVGIFAPSFVCKVDGEKLRPSKNGDFKAHPLRTSFKDTSLFINGSNSTKSAGFYIRDKDGITVKEYELSVKQNKKEFGWGSYADFTDTYNTDTNFIGKVEIVNIDYDKEIISGRFEFTAKHRWKNETVKITNGKFNVGFKR